MRKQSHPYFNEKASIASSLYLFSDNISTSSSITRQILYAIYIFMILPLLEIENNPYMDAGSMRCIS